MKQRVIALGLALVVFLLDRASKVYVEATVGPFDTIEVVPGFFNIIRTENTGMAFSLLTGYAGLLAVVAVGVIVMITYMLWTSVAGRLPLGLILGGAMGNLFDRALKGAVTDFLDVYYGDYHWATFNIADSAVTIGAILLLIGSFRKNVPEALQQR